MADRTTANERRWVLVAFAIIVVGVGSGILHQLDIIPLWLSTTATVLMGIGAVLAALAAARANRNDPDA